MKEEIFRCLSDWGSNGTNCWYVEWKRIAPTGDHSTIRPIVAWRADTAAPLGSPIGGAKGRGQRIAKHQFVALVREAEMHKTFSKNKTAPAGRRDKRTKEITLDSSALTSMIKGYSSCVVGSICG